MKDLKVGDHARVIGTPLEFEVLGFTTINDNKMVESRYGDFNIDLVEKLNTEFK